MHKFRQIIILDVIIIIIIVVVGLSKIQVNLSQPARVFEHLLRSTIKVRQRVKRKRLPHTTTSTTLNNVFYTLRFKTTHLAQRTTL